MWRVLEKEFVIYKVLEGGLKLDVYSFITIILRDLVIATGGKEMHK